MTIPQLKVQFKSGRDNGRTVDFSNSDRIVIGSSPSSDLTIDSDPLMQPQHFCIELRDVCEFHVIACHDDSLLSVNNNVVRDALVADGDIIRAGLTVLKVLLNTDADPVSKESTGKFETSVELDRFAGTVLSTNSNASVSASSANSETDSKAAADADHDALRAALLQNGVRLESEIGRGAFGRVFRGVDIVTRQAVAIKTLHQLQTGSADRVQLFLREMQIQQKLQHENIVQLISVGSMSETIAWLQLEYVSGGTLREFVRGRPRLLSVPDACRIAWQVVAALNCAHKLEPPEGPVVHRDIKPGNILIAQDNPPQVKICDFGMAKNFEMAGLSGLTATYQSRGNLQYMSPEQAIDSKYSGPEVDIYAAGGILFFCLTARSKYDVADNASPYELLEAKRRRRFVPISRYRNDVPGDVQAVFDRAVAHDPARRYRSAARLMADLRQILDRFEGKSGP